jgi:hypothetical protein
MAYPMIFNGDHAEFELEHVNTKPEDRPDWPLPSFDARDWAKAFCKVNPTADEGTMIAWFANALMRGYDEHAARAADAQPEVEIQEGKYRKKPVVIDAVQWTGKNGPQVQKFLGGDQSPAGWVKGGYVEIGTLEGLMVASLDDWIIKGVKGEFYPCKPDIFAMTYDPSA